MPRAAGIGAILILAAVLRLAFFVGLVSGDPQDDGIYYGTALAISREGPTYIARYQDRPHDVLANPVDQFALRPMVTYPIAASFAVFGPGEESAVAWGFIASLAVVWVVYRLGAVVHDRATGLMAALLCAFYPLEVINGTRILSDVQVGLFTALGLLLVFEGTHRGNRVLYVLAGAASAGAYLSNGRGLLAVAIVICCAAVHAWESKASWHAPLLAASGFLAVFAVEATVYAVYTGDPLLSYHVHAEAATFKYQHETAAAWRWGPLIVRHTNGEPLELLETVFLLRDPPSNQFGLFFYFFVAAALASLWRRRNVLLIAVTAGVFVFMEFGPVRLALDRATWDVHYDMMFKQPRFLMILSAPLLVIGAWFLRALWTRRRLAAVVIVLLLSATSLETANRVRNFYRAGLRDLREVTPIVTFARDRVFWSDYWATEHLRIFSHYEATNVRTLDPKVSIEHVAGGCVILGGSRGVELLADYVDSTLPPFIQPILMTGDAPDNWMLLREIKGGRSPQRTRDLRVYCLP